MRVALERAVRRQRRHAAARVAPEHVDQALGDEVRDLLQRQALAAEAGRRDGEAVAVIAMELLDRLHQRVSWSASRSGPRQLELPPKSPEFDSPGTYSIIARPMPGSTPRSRRSAWIRETAAHAVAREELALGQHALQHARAACGRRAATAGARRGRWSATGTVRDPAAVEHAAVVRFQHGAKRGVRFEQALVDELAVANSGMRPTHENTSMCWLLPSGLTTRSLKNSSLSSHSDRPPS